MVRDSAIAEPWFHDKKFQKCAHLQNPSYNFVEKTKKIKILPIGNETFSILIYDFNFISSKETFLKMFGKFSLEMDRYPGIVCHLQRRHPFHPGNSLPCTNLRF
jgi:hypothetical protein